MADKFLIRRVCVKGGLLACVRARVWIYMHVSYWPSWFITGYIQTQEKYVFPCVHRNNFYNFSFYGRRKEIHSNLTSSNFLSTEWHFHKRYHFHEKIYFRVKFRPIIWRFFSSKNQFQYSKFFFYTYRLIY